MSWPTAAAFLHAIRHAREAFEDAELRTARVAMDAHDQPVHVVGERAIVVRLDGQAGALALRVFLRDREDRARRYEALEAAFRKHRPAAMPPFRYLRRGIQIDGAWYPALVMPWIEGERLDHRVARLAADTREMRELADAFFEAMAELSRHNVAHGDIQPENVIVAPEGLRFVDYDTAYAPGMEALGAAEPGSPDWQHPRRARMDFAPTLDHFSACIMHVSLLAMSLDRSLHRRFGHPQRFLFARGDYESPGASAALTALRAVKGGAILAARVEEAIASDPLTVPPLEAIALPPPAPPESFVPERARAAPATTSAPPPSPPRAAAPTRAPAKPPVVHEPPRARGVAEPAFEPPRLERASVLVLGGALALLAAFAYARAVALPLVLALALLQVIAWGAHLAWAHALQPAVRERRRAIRRLQEAEKALADAERAAAAASSDLLVSRGNDANAQVAVLREREADEVRQLERDAEPVLAQIDRERMALPADAPAHARAALDAKEAQVTDETRSAIESARARWRREIARAQAEADAASQSATRERRENEERREASQRELDAKRRAVEWAREDAARYAGLTFARYLRHVARPDAMP